MIVKTLQLCHCSEEQSVKGQTSLGKIDRRESYDLEKALTKTSSTERLNHVKMVKERNVVYVITRITRMTSLR